MCIFFYHTAIWRKIFPTYLEQKIALFVQSHGKLNIIIGGREVRREREISQLKEMWENLNMFDNIAFIWKTQIIINDQAEKSPINLKNSKLHYGSVSKERTAKMHVDVTSQRGKPSCFQIAVQGEDTMPEPWNLELCHCWFSVREGNMILCYCSYLLQTLSGIWYWSHAWWVAALNFPTDQCWCCCCMKE